MRERGFVPMKATNPPTMRLVYALAVMFGNQPVHLDHDPPLMLRRMKPNGEYAPRANHPSFLVWRTKEDHRIKTFVRGDGAQLSDAGKRRKEIRKRKKATRVKRKWPSRKIPSRGWK